MCGVLTSARRQQDDWARIVDDPHGEDCVGEARVVAAATWPTFSNLRILMPALLTRYERVRTQTERLSAPLEVEDDVIGSMPDVSPTGRRSVREVRVG